MDAVTYPNEAVVKFLEENVIPLRVPSDQQPLVKDFGVKWTPALFILDQDGNEHNGTVGFLGAEELLPSILLGIGKVYFDGDKFSEALKYFERNIDEYPDSDSTPETIFLAGVSRYKDSGDPKPLREAYDFLADRYPDSQWAKRAYPYRLIE